MAVLDFLRQATPLIAPLITALLTVLGFLRGRKSPAEKLRERCNELAELIPKVSDCHHGPLEAEISEYVSDLRAEYHYLRVRKLSGTTAATVVFVALVGGGSVGLALWASTWWAWLVASPVAIFCLLLELAGVSQLYEVPASDNTSPRRAHRAKA
ncbi:hypothetical protein ACFQRD_02185 [Brachybacterium sp. GCM10030268]|uniref:hypothetical protein n=1 Tax=Brachybacterium sp. GCM10030268 TaxID=3273382 RepID=UPI00361E72DC